MIDRKKVINDLESLCKKQNCPFVCFDALTLLNEQEAKLMTREEIINWDGYIWKEYKDISTMTVSEIKHEIEIVPYQGQSDTKNFSWNTYGKEWRCWSKCPTEEQRKEKRWDDENNKKDQLLEYANQDIAYYVNQEVLLPMA